MTDPQRDPVEVLVKLVAGVDPRLADTERARGAVELVERIQRQAATDVVEREGGKAWRASAWALAGALASAAGLLLWWSLRPPTVMTAPSHEQAAATAEKAAPTVPPDRTTPGDDLAILRILPHGARTLVSRRDRLQGRPGEDVQADLADAGRLALRGAGQVVVEELSPSGIVLGLDRGTLLVSFDHANGRGLAVRTKDVLVRVTGTVFAVRTGDGPSRVSVSRGSVEVETSGLPVSVTAGKSWEVGAKRLSALDVEIGQALRALRASEGAAGPLGASRASVEVAPAKEAAAAETMSTPAGTGGELTGASWAKAAQRPASRAVPSLAPPMVPAVDRADEADAEMLYRAAEKEMADGDSASAQVRLLALLARHPDHPLAGPAMYELGRLAFAAGIFELALRHFTNVRESTRADARRFREPAAFFICRSEKALGRRTDAIHCLERHRAEFPSSPHDSEALADLALLHLETPDCSSALRLADEYVDRYPTGSQAQAMQAVHDRCASSTLAAPGY